MEIVLGSRFKFRTSSFLTCFFCFFLFYILFEGLFRYVFFSLGLSLLVYTIKLIMLVMLLMKFTMLIKGKGFYVLLFLCWFLLLGIYNNGLDSALTSLFVFIPLFFFYLYPVNNIIANLDCKIFLFLLVLGFIGLVLDFYYEMPWVGFSTIIDGQTITSGKAWWVNGEERLAGFGRSSIETATMLSFLALVLMHRLRKQFSYLIIFICLFSIYLTTTKGAFLAFMLASIFHIIPKDKIFYRGFMMLSIVLIGNFILLLALFDVDVDYLIDLYFSLYERVLYMWPSAIELLYDKGVLLGGGLGVVGIASEQEWSAVDNLWLYIIVMFGFIFWFPFLIFLILSIKKIINLKYSAFYIFFFIYGITNNMIESIFGQVILAMLIADLTRISILKKGKPNAVL